MEECHPSETAEKLGSDVDGSFFAGGTTNSVDQHTVAAINDMRSQHDRANGAVYYALEVTGLYTDPQKLRKELTRVSEAYSELPCEGHATDDVEAIMKEASSLRARKLGLEVLLQTNYSVRYAVQTAEIEYATRFFEKDEITKKPVVILDQLIDLYDKSDEMAKQAPILQNLRAMTGLDNESKSEAERLIRLLLTKDLEFESKE